MTVPLTAVAVVVGIVGAVAAHRGRSDAVTPVRHALVVLLGSVLVTTVAAMVAMIVTPLDLFGVIHLLYLLATVSVPLTGLGLLVRARRNGGPRLVRATGVVLLVPALVGAYATHVAPFRLRVQHVEVALPDERAGSDEVRIAVLADLQTASVGDHERAAVDAVLDAEPDIVLLPGDLFQGDEAAFERELPALRDELARLEAPGGVFYVRGDTEFGDRADRLLAGLDVQVLAYESPAANQVRDELVAAAGDRAITILLAHRPDTVLHLPAGSGVDLTVAGHTHGGQVVLPGLGPLLTMSRVPRDIARGGLHEVAGNRVYVSPGVGMERGQAPQVRFLAPPTVAVLTLTG